MQRRRVLLKNNEDGPVIEYVHVTATFTLPSSNISYQYLDINGDIHTESMPISYPLECQILGSTNEEFDNDFAPIIGGSTPIPFIKSMTVTKNGQTTSITPTDKYTFTSSGTYKFEFDTAAALYDEENEYLLVVSPFNYLYNDLPSYNELLTSVTVDMNLEYDNLGLNNWCIGCKNLKTFNSNQNGVINITDNIVSISNCFYECLSINKIHIGSSLLGYLTYSGYNFMYPQGITEVEVDSNNPVYDSRNGCNALIETDKNEIVWGFPCSTIPNSVTKLGDHAFYNINSTYLVILNGVLNIPEGITEISRNCFFNYAAPFTSIILPSTLTLIGAGALDNGTNNNSEYCDITIRATLPPTINISSLPIKDQYLIHLYVPASSVNAYKNATGWSTYASKIQAIP